MRRTSRSRFTSRAALLLFTLSTQAAEPVHLGLHRELFVDDHLIGTLQGARLQLHAPQPRESVLTTDLPWEGGSGLHALAGQPVRLRFALRDADLYALQFPQPQ
jgi:hypothetical protein